MHTVIIADRHMKKWYDDDHNKYKRLFSPFLKESGGNICVCEWLDDIENEDIEHAVPELYDSIKGYPDWRAIIVTHSEHTEPPTFESQNPYDFIESRKERDRIKESSIPLIQLTHMLAGFPSIGTKGYEMGYTYFDEQSGKYEDCYYEDGQPVLQKKFDALPEEEKDEIRKKFGGGLKPRLVEIKYTQEQTAEHKRLIKKYNFNENRPIEIILLTTIQAVNLDEDEAVGRVWEYRKEEESSDFWQKSNYPNMCRFLYFNIRNPKHTLYFRDLWSFWLLTLTLAVNQLPGTSLQGYRLYRAELDIDPEMVCSAYEEYIKNLKSVQAAIHESSMIKPELTKEKKKELVPTQVVMVNYDYIDDSKIMVPTAKIGLATDCPVFEKDFWEEYVYKAKKTIDLVFSEPQEAVASKAEETREKIDGFYGKEQVLDRFQHEYINKRINELEPEVINTKVYGTLDTSKYKEEIKKDDNLIRKYIKCRITKRNIFLISLTTFLVYLGGFLPYLINAGKIDFEVLLNSLALTGVAIVLLGLGGIIVLGVLRRRFKKTLKDYNNKIRDMLDTVNKGAQIFSDYFSSVCTYMYAHSLLSGVILKKDNDYSLGKLQKAHLKTIDDEIKAKERLCSLYNIKLNTSAISSAYLDQDVISVLPTESHLYELMPNDDKNTLMLGNTGELLNAPYNFITGINLIREEIYKPKSGKKGA